MADTSLTSTKVANTDADPTGDLVLVIGSGDSQRSIRACSKVLSLASPVLAAMFRPNRFSEGTALSSLDPPEVYLPEDDPEAVTMFCHLVHFREYPGMQPGPSFDQLLNMALFCDKYDAGLAFNPWCELWLGSQLDFEKSGDYSNLLGLAYAFDNQESFWINSRNMMQYGTAYQIHGIRDELRSLLPEAIFASIDEDRKSGLLDLSSMFDHVLARFLQYSAGWSRSDARLIKVGHVLQELYDLNIWPISTRLNEINMDRIQSTFALFSEPDDTSFNRDLNTKILAAVDAQKGLFRTKATVIAVFVIFAHASSVVKSGTSMDVLYKWFIWSSE
ncbi:hypothetical protein IMSHALPRED_001531 [Imshaugia aleurites]|uniref:BTB domain-containing protein n=1 Tax=Imshaugia aleurites TaxID=172621 RepID=A0A8H3PEH0_9LECA|nr:hypothetical protein IMSHALPRED_001531 [Imshaugia aleurites]